MKHAATQELFSYWNRLRGERLAPERSDVDPGAIRGVLADTFILDTQESGIAPLRVAGARFSALFVNELKGADFLSIWEPESLPAVRDLIDTVAAEPAPAVAAVRAAPPGRPKLDLELLLLPLRHFGKTRARIMGCLSPAAVPPWLGLVPAGALELGPMRIIRPATVLQTEFARTLQSEALPVRHGHLRVHDGNNSGHSDGLHGTR